ncbi:MAG: ABC transporter substrate-binding protein [Chloroflexi bacterium]|nr:ABC transporter substrate-binding protein [Chloroflexota bacterium]
MSNAKKHLLTVFSTVVVAALLLAACAGSAPAPATATPMVATPVPVTIKVALLPIMDGLPIFVALQNGYFEANGVTVELVPVGSAAERDQVIQGGGADAMINDMISTALYNKDKVQVVSVGLARTATDKYPQYRILASAQSGITDVQGLKGVEIGISDGTVIAYTTDRLLQAEGLAPADIKTVAVPKIGDRVALLGSGELKAANLPDPAASLAINSGAVVIVDDTKHPEYGFSLYTFTASFVAAHPEAVSAFLAAVSKAAADINADKTKWDSLLADKKLLPQPLQGNYTLPDFPTTGVPTEKQFADVLSWAKDKVIVSADESYADSVKADFQK